MEFDPICVNKYLKEFDFLSLFIQALGWNYYKSYPLQLSVNNQIYILNTFAEKHGMVIYTCQPDSFGEIPNFVARRQIERELTKYTYEHLIIYTDVNQTRQIWQWVRRNTNIQQEVFREYIFFKDKYGDLSVPMLEKIFFPLNKEDDITLFYVINCVKKAFDIPGKENKFVRDDITNERITQEVLMLIAKFRLVKADNKIEFSEKIKCLLESEDVREQLIEQFPRKNIYTEWMSIINVLSENINSIFDILTDEDMEMVLQRCGLSDYSMKTLEEEDGREAKLLLN